MTSVALLGPRATSGVYLCATAGVDGTAPRRRAGWAAAGRARAPPWPPVCGPHPSSVSLMMSQISMLRAQSSLCREPSVAFSVEKKP